ncbi:MAG TPA: PIN domain-containing protein [Dehalococcoidia bacterium]|jgi:predicted nucleic acid-binding protein|nr:PIN domain-containing protein [Dehalococcoidia bacterium]
MTTDGYVYLIDSNILIYAYDAAEPAKQERALEVLSRIKLGGTGVLSVQILSEFYTNVTRKPLAPLSMDEAQATAIRYCRSWPILDLTDRVFLDAVGAVNQHKLSFWDALIWGTAVQNGVPYIVTEDQQHQRLVGSIRYLNPFDRSFELAQLS